MFMHIIFFGHESLSMRHKHTHSRCRKLFTSQFSSGRVGLCLCYFLVCLRTIVKNQLNKMKTAQLSHLSIAHYASTWTIQAVQSQMLGFVGVNGLLEKKKKSISILFVLCTTRKRWSQWPDAPPASIVPYFGSNNLIYLSNVRLTDWLCVRDGLCSVCGHNNSSVLATRQHSGFQLIYRCILRFFSDFLLRLFVSFVRCLS